VARPESAKGVNAQGDRWGLFAFRIVGVSNDSRSSYLPNLIITAVDPQTVDLTKVIAVTNTGGTPVRRRR
jgi:hypothetical protein